MKIHSSNTPIPAQQDTSKAEESSKTKSLPYKTKTDKPRSRNIFSTLISKIVHFFKSVTEYITKKNAPSTAKARPNPVQKENYMALHGLLDSNKQSPFSEAAQRAVSQAQKDLGDLTKGNANTLLSSAITALQMRLNELTEPFTEAKLEHELVKEIKIIMVKNYSTGELKEELQKRNISSDEGSLATLMSLGGQDIKKLITEPTDGIPEKIQVLISHLANHAETIKNFTETKNRVLSMFIEGATKNSGQTESEVKASPEYKELESNLRKERDRIEDTQKKGTPDNTKPISTQIFKEALFTVAEQYFKKYGIQSSNL